MLITINCHVYVHAFAKKIMEGIVSDKRNKNNNSTSKNELNHLINIFL